MKQRLWIASAIVVMMVWIVPATGAEETSSTSGSSQVKPAQPAKKPMRRLLMSGKKPAKKPAAAPVVSRVEDKVIKEKKEKDRVYGWERDKKDR